MKKYKLHTFDSLRYTLLFLITLWIVSCNDEILVNDNFVNEKGFVDIKLTISAPEQDKIISSRVADKAVQNLYVLVFDEKGVVSREYYELNNDKNNGYVTTRMPIGQVYIYGFANINSEVYGDLKPILDGIGNRQELKDLTLSVLSTAKNLQRAGSTWLMAGTCTDKADVEYYTVTKDTKDIQTILLRRLDSEIKFNFKKGTNCTEFKATNWYCVNAPAKSFLIEHKADRETDIYGNWDASDNAQDYYSTLSQLGNNTIFDNTFTFYIPENRKPAKKSISNYNEREKEKGDKHECDQYGRRNYTNAPDNGTYIVVNGTFKGRTSASQTEGLTGEQEISATVTYAVHLGYINNIAKDFFSNRNTKYTYNITVNGVDDIIVEVEQDIENSPGATGEVIFQTGSNIYQLDAHYETVLLSFELNDLVSKYRKNTLSGPKFLCVVQTPYSNMPGIDEEKDRAWVKVSRNNNASADLQDYRGATLMSIDMLLGELEEAVTKYIDSNETDIPALFTKQGDKYVVTYTCFIDEFYYDEEDLPVAKSALEDGGVNIWKSFANQPNRKMYLVCSTQNSKDEESSIISAAYILSQRSIRTFYSTEPESEKVIAYGIETLNETGVLPWGLQDADALFVYCDSKFGWDNTKYLFNNRNWSTIVNSSSNGYKTVQQNEQIINGDKNLKESLNTAYQKAYIACMQRNRNEKGTDAIDDGDIKWYLPSISQCQAFYIGEAALADARLFNYPLKSPIDTKRDEVHYASSTFDGEKGGSGDGYLNSTSFRVLWAEEGTSTSTFNQANKWGYNDIKTIHYRCVRNLGTVKEGYDNFYKKDRYIISYSKLNDASKDRSKVTNGELGVHDYNSGNNRFYKGGFEIYPQEMPYTPSFRDVVTNETYTVCQDLKVASGETRWRAPNLRELTLMVLSEDDCKKYDYVFARTRCPYPQRIGWRILTQNVGMQGDNKAGKIRCVRDVN
jgi:hypothetical protein